MGACGAERASGATGYLEKKEVAYAKAPTLVNDVVTVVVTMLAVSAGTAFASPPAQADRRLAIAFAKSGGKAPPRGCDANCE